MIVMFSFQEEVQWIVNATLTFCQRHQLTETLKPEQALELIRCLLDDAVSERLQWAPIGHSYNKAAEAMMPWYHPAAMDTLSDSYWSLVMDRVFGQVRLATHSIYPNKTWDVVAVNSLKDDTVVVEKIDDWRILQYEQLKEEQRILPSGWQCRSVNGHPVVIQSFCDPLTQVTDGFTD